MVTQKGIELLLAVGGVGVYWEFLSTPVPTPVGLVLALAVLPTGDVIRLATAIMNKQAKAISASTSKKK